MKLPPGWRKLTPEERRSFLAERLESAADFFSGFGAGEGGTRTADAMIENAVGYYPVPLGVVTGLVADGEEFAVPIATEEASVIAAASFASRVIASSGGFRTSATESVMTVQVFVADGGSSGDAVRRVESVRSDVVAALSPSLAAMEARGGGFRSFAVAPVAGAPFVRAEIGVDVRDAMGANLLNACGEVAASRIEDLTGLRPLMAIVSNGSALRRARSSFSLSFDALSRAARGLPGKDTAERIAAASLIAATDRDRAITHNKGIMNGVAGLATATGNDVRAVEAAVHAWASRDGTYRALSSYAVRDGYLDGELEIPAPFAAVGGAVGVNPGSAFALELLGSPDARKLGRIAAALGLAQNFAALLALTTEGIQRGHMGLHDRRKGISR